MDIVYEHAPVTAVQVREALPDAPSYSAVRALLRILESKGHIRHQDDAVRYLFSPVKPRSQAARSTLRQVVQTFFGGSIERTVATLLSSSETQISTEELDRLAALIEAARKEGR